MKQDCIWGLRGSSCVISAIEVILSPHVLGALIKLLKGNECLVDRSQQELPQFRFISEFGNDFFAKLMLTCFGFGVLMAH